jgi:ABC-type branched-subunit amino acid transport system substrate-binding protein
MFACFAFLRKLFLLPALLVTLLALSACQGGPVIGGGTRVGPDATVPVALLVPRGAADSNEQKLAADLENAARMAVSDLSGVAIDLRVYDSAGTPERAGAAAQTAVTDGARIIIGPLRAASARAAADAVAPRGVNVLAFSNDPTIAGDNLFVLGQTFHSTAERLVGFAAEQGRDRILTVHADNRAGRLGRQAIQDAITRNAARPAGDVSYAVSQEAVVEAVPRITAAAEENGANAIFFTANSAGALPLFTQMLPEAGLDRDEVQYIGLSRWDTPPQTLELPGVQGGWFALPDPRRTAQFRSRFEQAHDSAPHALSGLAYDGIAAVGALVREGGALDRAALTQPAGFRGVNGIFRFTPEGTNERGLAVATIRDKQVEVISPAPTSFGGAGL